MNEIDKLRNRIDELETDYDNLDIHNEATKKLSDIFKTNLINLHEHFELLQMEMNKYLIPNSNITKDEFIANIITLLDGPAQRDIQWPIKDILRRL